MSDEQKTESQATEVEREERRLERLRLVTQLSPTPEPYEDEPGPKAA